MLSKLQYLRIISSRFNNGLDREIFDVFRNDFDGENAEKDTNCQHQKDAHKTNTVLSLGPSVLCSSHNMNLI